MPDNFEEEAHLSSDGSFDMYEIMKALYDIGFTGPIRPDHGRMIWDEAGMAELVCGYFRELTAGPEAVRKVLLLFVLHIQEYCRDSR